ncbi:MAG TPA: acyl-CoA synthetase FdrA [Ktedonobacteraceae bacterium]|nr:acyl-CoA synthetase FdrA [Ktedonobacteraceae bacterium]
MKILARVKRSSYFDSITLMKIARSLTEMPGVEDAAAIMATEPNLQLLAEAGLAPFEGVEGKPGPDDVLIVVRAGDEATAQAALQTAEEQLGQLGRRTGASSTGMNGMQAGPGKPRSLEQATQLHPDARLALISVPGMYAALEAEQALRAGLHVFLFSDNVKLEQEIALKHMAQERNLLLMGPDCGTAMINGAGLGFVNVVPRGPIGIVGASGTGTQQVMSLIAQQGSGVSQVIGCGGRDLSEAVGAITTLQGLRLLQADEQTQVIVLISKPPAQAVAERVLEVAASGQKPVIVIFVGADRDALESRYRERLIIARTLAEAAMQAVSMSETGKAVDSGQARTMRSGNEILPGRPQGDAPTVHARATSDTGTGYRLAALFSGGTLCDEAMHIWAGQIGPIYSNIPLKPEWRLAQGQRTQGHFAIDFGADEYTHGRPHPMIDPGLRLKRLQEEAGNPRVGVILLDMVLGYCAHPDPAAVYAPVIAGTLEQAASQGRALNFVISLCGTEGDPQRLSRQAARFREAGAEVFTSNADAAWRCVELLTQAR